MTEIAESLESALQSSELEEGKSLTVLGPGGDFRVSVRALLEHERVDEEDGTRIALPAEVSEAQPVEPLRWITIRLDRSTPYPIYFSARPEDVWQPPRVGFFGRLLKGLWGGIHWTRVGAFVVGATRYRLLEAARSDALARYGEPFTAGDAEFDGSVFSHSVHPDETRRRLHDNDVLPGLRRLLTANAPFAMNLFFGVDEVTLTTTATDRTTPDAIRSWVSEIALLRELLGSD